MRRQQPQNIQPTLSTDDDWRVPKTFFRYAQALADTPKDGEWYVVVRGFASTTGEQTARANNRWDHPDWEFGYRVRVDNGEIVSDLAIRFVGTP